MTKMLTRFNPGGSLRPIIVIPSFFCAPAISVRCEGGRFCSKLLETDSWERACEGVKFIDIEAAPFMLVFNGPPMDGVDDSDNVMLYPFSERLANLACVQGYRYRARIESLMFEGMKHFWVSLALLAGGTPILPRERDPEKRYARAIRLLTGFLGWWDIFHEIRHRF